MSLPAAGRLVAAHRAVLGTAAVLACCVAWATLVASPWPRSLAWTALMLVPVLMPLGGLLRGDRRTHAWATFCVAPYFLYGLTEVIANPSVRAAAAAILFASLAWFVALIAYLRFSRPLVAAPAVQDAPGA
ncbi:MAG: DUF2069 domain-containing protein [Lysobacterales bacterium]|nr:MAG: DUF2069 domain-containing protein [Xanthomonadales bacterium]